MTRWMENYLRHECTTYDWLLQVLGDEFRGLPGAPLLYEGIVRPAVDLMVEEKCESCATQRNPVVTGDGRADLLGRTLISIGLGVSAQKVVGQWMIAKVTARNLCKVR